MLAVMRSMFGAVAIARAEERGDVERWLAHALAEIFAQGPLEAIQGIAAMTSESDVASVLQEGERKRKGLSALVEQWKQEAKAQGEPAYFPFGPPDHAEG